MSRHHSNIVGFDDGPFARDHRGDVVLVGAVCSRTRLDGVLVDRVRRDGRNATSRMIAMIERSQFRDHVQAVLLQGIAVAGFNVVDVHALARALGIPVLAIARRRPDYPSIERALRTHVRDGARKWELVLAAGEMERIGEVWVQRVGIERSHAATLLRRATLHGHLPEPLRLAHLIAGGVVDGTSRGRA